VSLARHVGRGGHYSLRSAAIDIGAGMGYDLRPMSTRADDPVLLALREEIAAADRDLLAAFTRRLQVAAKIRAHKVECGYDFVDLEREQRLLEEWRQANGGAVSDETLLELFESVLSLSKREAQR
jgi:chorismate mutase